MATTTRKTGITSTAWTDLGLGPLTVTSTNFNACLLTANSGSAAGNLDAHEICGRPGMTGAYLFNYAAHLYARCKVDDKETEVVVTTEA